MEQVWHQGPNSKYLDSLFEGMISQLKKAVNVLLKNMHIDTAEKKANKVADWALKAGKKFANK